jgi:hypothetical protein
MLDGSVVTDPNRCSGVAIEAATTSADLDLDRYKSQLSQAVR